MKFVPEMSLPNIALPLAGTETHGIYQTDFGRHLVAKKKLDQETIEVLRREKITSLAITSLGFKGPLDLNILRLYPELTSLTLVEPPPVDWTPLQYLPNLPGVCTLRNGIGLDIGLVVS